MGVIPLFLLAGCAATARPSAPGPACGREPAVVLACVRAREDAVTSMRARFTATTRREGESSVTTGVLLVSKPERFRLRLMLPFGLTVFDCVKNGEEVQMSLPLQGRTTSSGDPQAPLPFAEIDLDEAYLRGTYAFPGTCEADGSAGETVTVHCGEKGAPRQRVLHLDRRSATLLDETSYVDGTPRFVLRYGDYRPAGGTSVVLPHEIALGYPARGVTLDIDIERYEVNPALADDLFQPLAP